MYTYTVVVRSAITGSDSSRIYVLAHRSARPQNRWTWYPTSHLKLTLGQTVDGF